MNAFRGATFPVRARLIKPYEFKKVFNKSVVSSDRCFNVLARRNQRGFSRLGMAVSRQVDRHAVGRNRIKRVIRESFRQSFETVVSESMVPAGVDKPKNNSKIRAGFDKSCPGIDVVVLPRRQAATICNHQLFQSLQVHWSRLKQETG